MTKFTVTVFTSDESSIPPVPIKAATVTLSDQEGQIVGQPGKTDENGAVTFDLDDGTYNISAQAFGHGHQLESIVVPDQTSAAIHLGFEAECTAQKEDSADEISYTNEGDVVVLNANIQSITSPPGSIPSPLDYVWNLTRGKLLEIDEDEQKQPTVHWDTVGAAGIQVATVTITDTSSNPGASVSPFVKINVRKGVGVQAISDQIQTTRESGMTVDMERSRRKGTPEILTWQLIRQSTNALSFTRYKAFMDYVLCNDDEGLRRLDSDEQEKITGPKTERNVSLRQRRFLPYTDTEAYRLLKVATEAFLVVNCGTPLEGVVSEEVYESLLDRLDAEDGTGLPRNGRAEKFWEGYRMEVNGSRGLVLPYLTLVLNKLPDVPIKKKIFSEDPFDPDEADHCYGILSEKVLQPCLIELIWSYWHEEGMLVQTMNAISRRFQNVRGPAERDPLAMVEIDPLRPLNNLLWGYIQDEQHRLTVVRRAYEYDHHYGLTLAGKAVPALRTADSRSRFLDAFHQLLHLASVFYKQDDDTTMVADGFALLNALRDLHMVLSENAHNQYGALPSTARIEMLMQEWLLARPEFRELLPSRTMVAYPEPWMDRVDGMKRLQAWGDSSVTHFRFLGMYGEQILLSVRFTRWSDIDNADLAAIWARFFRDQIQGYIYAYRAVTGVDLTAETTTDQQQALVTTQPSLLLRQRLLAGGGATPQLAAPTDQPASFRQRRANRVAAK